MKKKILIIIYQLKIGGGAERVFSNLSKNLSEKYDISILTFLDFKEKYPYKGKYYSLQENLHSKSKFLNPFHLVLRFIKIYKLIRKLSPDIIITTIDLTNVLTASIKFIFHIKVPLIVSVRTNPQMAYKNQLRYLNPLIKITYSSKLINKIITVSKEINNILEFDYNIDRTKLKTIYNGIELESIEKKKQEKIEDNIELFDNEDIIKFITVGRLIKLKGHRFLIKAFSEVKKEIKNIKLIIIGEGPSRAELELLIDNLKLKNDVLLLGEKKNPYKYLFKSDIFVLSSEYEGLPNVILEALACGLPIISTRCQTGPEEILEDGKYGFLVKVGDSEDMAETMILLAKNEELFREFVKKSLIRAKFFDSREIINKWIKLIESNNI